MAAADRTRRAAMQLEIQHASLVETMALIPVLAEHVSLEVRHGDAREVFLFARGVFCGPESSLHRLRRLLAGDELVDVSVRAHATLPGLYGPPITALELVLDPSGALGTG